MRGAGTGITSSEYKLVMYALATERPGCLERQVHGHIGEHDGSILPFVRSFAYEQRSETYYVQLCPTPKTPVKNQKIQKIMTIQWIS